MPSEPFENWPEVMTVSDVIKCLGMLETDVYKLFNQPDFPQVIPGKRKDRMVDKVRLLKYLRGER